LQIYSFIFISSQKEKGMVPQNLSLGVKYIILIKQAGIVKRAASSTFAQLARVQRMPQFITNQSAKAATMEDQLDCMPFGTLSLGDSLEDFFSSVFGPVSPRDKRQTRAAPCSAHLLLFSLERQSSIKLIST